MPFRSFSYWVACSITAVIAVGATEPDKAGGLALTQPDSTMSSVLQVPEPSRAVTVSYTHLDVYKRQPAKFRRASS